MRRLVERPAGPTRLTDLHPVLARVYAARGVRGNDELDLRLANLVPFGRLGSIDRAVALLLEHRDRRILIVGDFDADGATSTALMMRCLNDFGFADVRFLVPNRFDFGYGLSRGIVDVAAELEPALIVTVDNGVSSHAGIERARALGIRVLVTDHHLPPATLPAADVIVNPNLAGDDFPSKHLAGVGVAFGLMAALGRRLTDEDPAHARVPARYLDLVALGTVADVVPLDRNNRILVAAGLERIRAGRTVPGIRALLLQAGRALPSVSAAELGFVAGPRLNAAGRLEDMTLGIQCLVTDSHEAAADMAERLGAINVERRRIERTMQEDALRMLDDVGELGDAGDLPDCITLYAETWHQGVVGLVASRVRERTHRPVLAFAPVGDDALKGSGRSVPDVHMRDLLEAVHSRHPGLIRKFGGHAMAAGLEIAAADFDAFGRAVALLARERFPDACFDGILETDGELSAADLTLEFAEALRAAGPWGQAFPEPVFAGEFHVRAARVVGERHLKLEVAPAGADGVAIDAIAFNQAEAPLPADGDTLTLAYRLDINEWRGRRSVQLVVEQWQP